MITVPGGGATCEVQMHAQMPGGSVDITDETAGGDVRLRFDVSSLAYTVTKDGFGCPFNGTGAKAGARYLQHFPITFDSAVNIQVSG